MQFGGNGDGDRVDAANQIVRVEPGAGAVGRRDLGGALAVGIDDANELHPGHRRENPRVVFAKMADADHRHP